MYYLYALNALQGQAGQRGKKERVLKIGFFRIYKARFQLPLLTIQIRKKIAVNFQECRIKRLVIKDPFFL